MEQVINYSRSQNILWITMINYGYTDFTINFLKHLKKHNINMKLIVLCLDNKTYLKINNNNDIINYCIPVLIDFISNNKYSDKHAHWGKFEFKKITFAKLDCISYIHNLLKQNNINCHTGYIDTDIIVFKDINNYILSTINNYSNIDIFCQCDENIKVCSNKFKCINACTGVIVFRNTMLHADIFKYTKDDVIRFSSDQDYIRFKLFKHNIPYITFEKNYIANGPYYNLTEKQPINDYETLLVHFNWMIGNDKYKNMKIQNLWLV